MNTRAIKWIIPVATLMVSMLFLIWALRTPRLERVWKVGLSLRLGDQEALDEEELRHLQEALQDYSGLASDLRGDQHAGLISPHEGGRVHGGHAYLIREPKDGGNFQVRYAYPRQSGEVRVTIRSGRSRWQGISRPGAPLILDLGSAKGPELIELQLSEVTKKGSARTPFVQIDWLEVTP